MTERTTTVPAQPDTISSDEEKKLKPFQEGATAHARRSIPHTGVGVADPVTRNSSGSTLNSLATEDEQDPVDDDSNCHGETVLTASQLEHLKKIAEESQKSQNKKLPTFLKNSLSKIKKKSEPVQQSSNGYSSDEGESPDYSRKSQIRRKSLGQIVFQQHKPVMDELLKDDEEPPDATIKPQARRDILVESVIVGDECSEIPSHVETNKKEQDNKSHKSLKLNISKILLNPLSKPKLTSGTLEDHHGTRNASTSVTENGKYKSSDEGETPEMTPESHRKIGLNKSSLFVRPSLIAESSLSLVSLKEENDSETISTNKSISEINLPHETRKSHHKRNITEFLKHPLSKGHHPKLISEPSEKPRARCSSIGAESMMGRHKRSNKMPTKRQSAQTWLHNHGVHMLNSSDEEPEVEGFRRRVKSVSEPEPEGFRRRVKSVSSHHTGTHFTDFNEGNKSDSPDEETIPLEKSPKLQRYIDEMVAKGFPVIPFVPYGPYYVRKWRIGPYYTAEYPQTVYTSSAKKNPEVPTKLGMLVKQAKHEMKGVDDSSGSSI